jgi:hypothetical protein
MISLLSGVVTVGASGVTGSCPINASGRKDQEGRTCLCCDPCSKCLECTMSLNVTSKAQAKRWRAFRRRWPWWRAGLAAACFLVLLLGTRWYGITTNVLRSPSPAGVGITQALIFMAGLPFALALGIGPLAREHKADAFIGVGFTLSMLYLFSSSIAERHHVDLAFANGPSSVERIEFMLTHFEVARVRSQIPHFVSSDGERTWRPPILSVGREHIGRCVTLSRRIAHDGTRLIEGQDALTVASFHNCPATKRNE